MKEQITIVCADTRDSERDLAAATVAYCQNIFPCKEAILFTNKPVVNPPNNITIISNIRSLNTNKVDYDFFMLTQLPYYIKTTHYLIVQTDGFILNPSAWCDLFLDYHYIGAPWQYHPMHHWPPHKPVSPSNSVGNGGFCLRSRLLGLTAADLFRDLSRQSSFQEPHWYPEDCFIARDMREVFEHKGFIFAPEDIANQFSVENKKYTGQFGFHGPETMRINNISKVK